MFDERRADVSLQVVDGEQRQVALPGDRLGRADADQQRADEPGPLRHRDRVDVVERRLRLFQRLFDDDPDRLHVVARGKFRHDPAERAVDVDLRGDDRRAHVGAVVDDRGGRLVAGGLDAEDPGHDPRFRAAFSTISRSDSV